MSHCQRILLPLCLLLIPCILHAQSISRSEADSLLGIIDTTKLDSNRVKIWLGLGQHQVYKPGEFKADMDSARTYARKAYELSRSWGITSGNAAASTCWHYQPGI
jgi:hypothetical protein